LNFAFLHSFSLNQTNKSKNRSVAHPSARALKKSPFKKLHQANRSTKIRGIFLTSKFIFENLKIFRRTGVLSRLRVQMYALFPCLQIFRELFFDFPVFFSLPLKLSHNTYL